MVRGPMAGALTPATSFDGYCRWSIAMIMTRVGMIFVEVLVSMPEGMMVSTVRATARKTFFVCLFMGIVDSLVRGAVLAVISSMLVCLIVGERGECRRC